MIAATFEIAKLYATPPVYVGKRFSQDLKTPLKQVLPGPSVLRNEHRVSIQAAFADVQNPLKADNLSVITLTLLLSCLWFVSCLTAPHTHTDTQTHTLHMLADCQANRPGTSH